jgi:hypothetical protein
MDFANNIEIKCRERCNWSETNSNDLKCKKDDFGWLELQENMDKYTVEKVFRAKLRDESRVKCQCKQQQIGNFQE